MFEAYITNTALYPLMGIEVGTTVHFPTTTQELQAALAKIGIDGKRYSEVFFTSFDSDVLGLYDHLYECENIDELNELGHALLEVRDKGGLETFEAALILGNHTRSVKDLINLTQNLDLYRFYPDISDDEGLGRLYADELGTIDIPEHIQNYFDYEAYGRDVRINEGGVFAPGGYVSAVPEGFKEYYHGPQDIPPEHRIFAYVGTPKDFDRIAKEFHVDYAFHKVSPGHYLLFFKANQADAITAAFQKYSAKVLNKEQDKASILGQLRNFTEQIRTQAKEKQRTREAVKDGR